MSTKYRIIKPAPARLVQASPYKPTLKERQMAGLPLTDHEVALLWPDATEADLESEFERDAAREERRIMRSPIARRLSAFVQGDDWMKGEHNEESLQFLGNKQPWKEDT